jgi:hypothetical protein
MRDRPVGGGPAFGASAFGLRRLGSAHARVVGAAPTQRRTRQPRDQRRASTFEVHV